MSAIPPAVAALIDAYAAAVYAKDADAFAALYDRDVRIFDTWGRWSYEGADAWRAMATEWFGSLGDERVEVRADDVRAFVSGDVGVAHAYFTYRGLAADGTPLRAMDNRLTWALRHRDGAWKIIHEHTSAPADFETKAISLHRERRK